jgi:integrase
MAVQARNLSPGSLLPSSVNRHKTIAALSCSGVADVEVRDLPLARRHLRAVAASAMVAAGVDVKTAQRRLAHSNITLTLQVYARATAETDRRAAELMG